MKRTSRDAPGIGATVCGLLAALLPGLATGAEGGPINDSRPYVSVGLGHDSNVFRVDDEDLLAAGRSDDGFWTAEAGFDKRLTRGIQSFDLHALVYHNDYSQLDEVDFTGGDAKLTWDWAVGRLWSGALGYEYRRELRDFANQLVPRVDTKTSNIVSGSVERRLSGRTRLGARGQQADIDFSQAGRLSLRRTGAGASLAFDSLAGNTLSLDADYWNRDSDGSGGIDNTELLVGPAIDWRITDKSRLRATLQYTDRDEENPALLDYSGLTGRISGQWRSATGNTVLASAWHEVSSLGDEIANYALVTGVRVSPTFSIDSRVSVRLELGYEYRDFKGDEDRFVPPGGLDVPLRDDDVLTGAIGVAWRITERIDLLFDYDAQYRDSNRSARDYEYHRVQMAFRVGL